MLRKVASLHFNWKGGSYSPEQWLKTLHIIHSLLSYDLPVGKSVFGFQFMENKDGFNESNQLEKKGTGNFLKQKVAPTDFCLGSQIITSPLTSKLKGFYSFSYFFIKKKDF